MSRTLFVGGTSSNSGKSWMVTALCAWLRSKGVSVAPFKAQNMSNNSYPCLGGGEIGRAQVAQAEACGLEPEPAMNPILLKPNGNGTSQVVVNGRMWKTMTAREYYACSEALRPKVLAAYEELTRRFDVVIIEGAGSVSELNLRDHDLVNLGLVTRIGAPWILVADIERGGVFASIVGTMHLLTATERALFRGFAINKFRGDVSLFGGGVRMLEERTASRCLGVFPCADIELDAEDSLALRTGAVGDGSDPAIAIVRLPHISNATDFRLLTTADWLSRPSARHYDFIVLPGTKNTIVDMQWLRANGFDTWIVDAHRRGTTVVGICGGYQMCGRAIVDPTGVESSVGEIDGLGLVDAVTELRSEKTVRAVRARTRGGVSFCGYEIHVGVTTHAVELPYFAQLDDGSCDGVWTERVVGTYLHGALEDAGVCAEIFGVRPPEAGTRAEQYRRLGAWFGTHVRHVEELGLI